MLMRIKGVKPVTVRRAGKVYRYYRHRKTGATVKSEFGTAAFAAEVASLDRRATKKPLAGTLGGLVAVYRESGDFTDLAPRTRKDYDKVFYYLKPLNDEPLHLIDMPFVYGVRDKAYKKHKRRFANYVVQVIRLLLEWGRPRGHVATNRAVGVKTIRRPKHMRRANRAWDDAERDIVLASASVGVRAMVAMGMFAGLREGDACAFLKTGYDGTAIEAVAGKNGEQLWIPAHYRLREILAEAARDRKERLAEKARKRRVVAIDPPTLAVNAFGQPWTESGFRASFFKLIRRLVKDGKVRPGLTFHGLRHTVGKLVIEGGGTTKDVGTILGDRSEAMAELYSRDFEKKTLNSATMLRLERNERARMDKQADNLSVVSVVDGAK